MKTKFNGPWRVSNTQQSDYQEVISDCEGNAVAGVYHDDPCDLTADEKGVVRLVVAAPEMYAALKNLYVDACDRDETRNPDTGEEYDDWKQARLVLEEIEGELR